MSSSTLCTVGTSLYRAPQPVTKGRRGRSENLNQRSKMLDKEVPYKGIIAKDLHLYHEAETVELDDHLKNKSVRIAKGKQVQDTRKYRVTHVASTQHAC